MSVRILLADDEPLIRAGPRAIPETTDDLTVVAEATNGAEVLPLVRTHQPGVVMMDVHMPTVDGIQATRHLQTAVAHPHLGHVTGPRL